VFVANGGQGTTTLELASCRECIDADTTHHLQQQVEIAKVSGIRVAMLVEGVMCFEESLGLGVTNRHRELQREKSRILLGTFPDVWLARLNVGLAEAKGNEVHVPVGSAS